MKNAKLIASILFLIYIIYGAITNKVNIFSIINIFLIIVAVLIIIHEVKNIRIH